VAEHVDDHVSGGVEQVVLVGFRQVEHVGVEAGDTDGTGGLGFGDRDGQDPGGDRGDLDRVAVVGREDEVVVRSAGEALATVADLGDAQGNGGVGEAGTADGRQSDGDNEEGNLM
jgi:hypothetical protein